MKSLFNLVLAFALFATACSQKKDSPIIQEYKALLALHDSSYHVHADVDHRQDDLGGYHAQLKEFIAKETNPDTFLLRVLARHETFFTVHDSIMQSHAAIMKQHEAFKSRWEAGEVADEELRSMIDQMRAEHDQMDADHAYVVAETRKLRSEHNALRKQYNELRTKQGK